MLTCKQATHLVSQRLDSKLSRRERIALRIHVWMCRNCRRFERQLQFIRHAFQRGVQEGQVPGDKSLSQQGKERIRQALQQNKDNDPGC